MVSGSATVASVPPSVMFCSLTRTINYATGDSQANVRCLMVLRPVAKSMWTSVNRLELYFMDCSLRFPAGHKPFTQYSRHVNYYQLNAFLCLLFFLAQFRN